MSSVILSDRGDEQKIIAEEKEEWLYQVLVALGIEEDFITDYSNEDIVSYMTTMEIEVFNNYDSSIDILRKGKIVAQWKLPKLILIKKGKKLYYEIHLKEWALPFQMSGRGER